ncbi:MAG: flagellar basal body rod protein FlgB [Pseudomonadales bacterium]|nr:flagellar basal body rod protein FlgB [Pseudomonadales bacterium]
MTINFQNALGVHEQALLLRDKRTELLAANIANADTPGYKARDIDFRAVLNNRLGLEQGLSLRSTHAGHLAAGRMDQPGLSYRVPLQPSPDGNTVDEQVENAAFARNALEHQASFEFLNDRFAGLIKALRGE